MRWDIHGFESDRLVSSQHESRSDRVYVTDADVVRFLREDIASLERLGVLLLMRREANRWWSAHAVALELSVPLDAVQTHLEHLSRRNLLDVRVSESIIYCFKPGTDNLARLVDRVVDAHSCQLDAVAKAFPQAPA